MKPLWAPSVLLLAGCGYHPVYGAGGTEALCVRTAPVHISEFGAVKAAVRGAMRELQRAGAFAKGTEDPCMVIELLRVEETPTGIAVTATRSGEQPRATGSEVWVTGRAWVERSGAVSRDTGDVRRASRGAAAAGTPSALARSTVADSQRYRALVAGAAEDLGQALAERILGLPSVEY